MIRKGLGLGKGTGYYNIAPMDSYVHSLSAKGVKTKTFLKHQAKNKEVIYVCADCGIKWETKWLENKPKCPNCRSNLYVSTQDCLNNKDKERLKWYEDWKYLEGLDAKGNRFEILNWSMSAKGFGFKQLYSEFFSDRLSAKGKVIPKQRSIMWNPKTGEMLQGQLSHSTLLTSTGKSIKEFNEWVRGIYSPEHNKLFIRHYFAPKSNYAEFTADDFVKSEKMQLKFRNKLQVPRGTKVVYNITNPKLRQEGYIHF